MNLLPKYVKTEERISENWNDGFAGGRIVFEFHDQLFPERRVLLIYFLT